MTLNSTGTVGQIAQSVQREADLYDNLKNLLEERDLLRLVFPGLSKADFDCEYFNRIQLGEIKLPFGAASWVAMPNWRKIAEDYVGALCKVFTVIQPFYNKFHYNGSNGNIDNLANCFRLRQSERTIRSWKIIAAEQKDCGLYIVPIRFDPPMRVESYNAVPRKEFAPNNFGPGVLMSAIFMLMNEVDYGSGLYLDCQGDEYWPDISSTFPQFKPPCLLFQDKDVYFFPIREGSPDLGGNYFSITAFANASNIVTAY